MIDAYLHGLENASDDWVLALAIAPGYPTANELKDLKMLSVAEARLREASGGSRRILTRTYGAASAWSGDHEIDWQPASG